MDHQLHTVPYIYFGSFQIALCLIASAAAVQDTPDVAAAKADFFKAEFFKAGVFKAEFVKAEFFTHMHTKIAQCDHSGLWATWTCWDWCQTKLRGGGVRQRATTRTFSVRFAGAVARGGPGEGKSQVCADTEI